MSKTIHLCLDVSGALREASAKARTRPRAVSWVNHDSGRAMTWVEWEATLKIHRNAGHEFLPMDNQCNDPCPRVHLGCTGFQFAGQKKGCPGHRTEAEAA